jgi:hypothetical protein
MDTTGLVTFFTAILTAAVATAGLLAAVALAASGLRYFGVVGHSQRAMEQAQNGVRASFIGLALVWGAKELVNLSPAPPGKQGCTEDGGFHSSCLSNRSYTRCRRT